MNAADPEELSAFAGEYVLGTLDQDERQDAERELASNPAFAAEVAAWQDRLIGLTARVDPVEPARGLWERIDAALPARTTAAPTSVVPPRVPVAGEARARQDAANEPLWRRVGLWQALSGMALAACLVLATLLVSGVDRRAKTADRYLAVLQSPDKAAGWIVEVSSAEPLKLRPLTADASVPAGKALQFWTKIDGAAGPTSLGLVHPGQPLEVELSKLPGVAGNQLFEITLEPPEGSPIGKPTGPVLFIGRSVKV